MRIDREVFLEHYASQYYDPVKAREYYLRTRELKGRSESNLKSEAKKEAWGYTKSKVGEAQNAELDAAAEAHKQAVESIRKMIGLMREAITQKLKEAMDKITQASEEEHARIAEKRAAKLEELAKETAKKIAAVPKVPKGLSKEVAAQAAAERSDALAAIRGEAKQQRQKVVEDAADEAENFDKGVGNITEAARGSANLDRQKVAEGLKGAVENARKQLEAKKQQVKAKYESVYQSEYDAIQKNV